MKERPILFSAPMVQAILAGTKTQTRRIAKPRRKPSLLDGTWTDDYVLDEGNREWLMRDCPFGAIVDRLWVRETFAEVGSIGKPIDWFEYQYRADFRDGIWNGDHSMCFDRWKPSIFMPRAASRITLEIESIHVERLQDINEADAIAEGVSEVGIGMHMYKMYTDYTKLWEMGGYCLSAAVSYQSLWESINGIESWDVNPWVWVITFKKI